ncbi:MAG: hypothetical protein MUQ30_15635, partial [Anaerolineae bacterium]|nr:hypothetical protein [Anaerolineae bacterium]
LGIPADAEKVLIFTESSHWDPNWLMTSEAYFDRFVRDNLDQAIEELRREPRRIYSIECMFFLRMYWERCPDKQGTVRALVNEGRFRLTSSGVTTADTLLPSTEAILRDFLIGQEWLRANGMTPEPTLAYFTDSFGAGQQRVGCGDPTTGQSEPPLVDQCAHDLLLVGATLPIHPQEEHTLDGVDATRFPLQLFDSLIKIVSYETIEVRLGSHQPVGIPMA